MVSWDVLDAQFDAETKQAKALANISSVFDVVKLALLEPDEVLCQIPKLVGAAYKGLIAISVGSTIVVFGDDGATLLLQLTLKKCIDILVWLPCGKFLLLADCLGYVHCIHIASKSLIFSRPVPIKAKEEENGGTFIDGVSYLEHNNGVVLILVTKHGEIVTLSGIDTKALTTGIESKDVALLTSIQSQLSMKVEDLCDFNISVSCVSFHITLEVPRAKVWLGTTEGIFCWTSHTSQSDSFLLSCLTDCCRLIVLQKGRYLAALQDGDVSMFCTETGILLGKFNSDVFREHVIVDFCELSAEHKCSQLLTLVSSTSDPPSYFLCLMSFPGFTIKHELPVTEDTFLVKLGDGVESSFFVEGKRDCDGALESLNLKNIIDGVPEIRLEKLLKGGKFEEAEIFCETFDLDVSEVYKANAKYLCDIINPWRTSNGIPIEDDSISRSFNVLLEILEKILDLEYVTGICSDAPMPDISFTKQLLAYGKQRIAENIQAQSTDHLKGLMHKISENLFDLCTYEMIYSDSNIHHWFEFNSKDILDQFFAHLKKGHLDVASTIWHRHQYTFCHKINNKSVETILESIPCNLPSDVVFKWLQNHILNDILRLSPSSIEVIAFWIDRKLKTIEFHEKSMWPTNALILAQDVITILNNLSSYFSVGGGIEVEMALSAAHEKAHSSNSNLYQLRMTALALQDLKVLADKFRLKIKFSQYTQESKYCVVKTLFDMLVCGDEVDPLFNNFLRDYMRQHDVNCDNILARYITDTLSSYGQAWWMWDQAPWENKLYAVIRIIRDAQIKSECILTCIQSASVPWSKGTIEICDAGIALNTSLRSQLESQSKLSNLKLVLRKYHIHKMNFTDSKIVELILRSVCQKEKGVCMSDAFIVVDAFCPLKKNDAYFLKICYFVRIGNIDEAVSLFKSIELQSDKLGVFVMMQNFVLQQLSVPPFTIKCKEKLNVYSSAVLLLEPIIKTCLKECQIADLQIIRRLSILQKFDIYLTIGELEDKSVCMQCLKELILRIYHERRPQGKGDCAPSKNRSDLSSSQMTNRNHSSYSNGEPTDLLYDLDKVLRVAHLLNVPKEDILTLIFKLLSSQGDSLAVTESAVSIDLLTGHISAHKCASLIYDMVETYAKFWVTADETCDPNLENHEFSNLIECQLKKLYTLVTAALPLASNDLLAQLTNVAMWCAVGIDLFNKCLLSKAYGPNKTNVADPLFEWSFSSMFKDVSVPMKPQLVTMAIGNILLYCCQMYKANVSMPFFDNEELNLSSQNDVMHALHELGNHLQDRNQDLIYATISLILSSHHINMVCNMSTVSAILHKRILSKSQDLAYTLSLLTILRPQDSLRVINEAIKKIGSDYSYLLAFANVGIDLCRLLRLKEVCRQFRDLARKARWDLKFEKLGLSFVSYFSEERKSLEKGLNDLTRHKDCNLDILAEFSDDFNWDSTNVYLCYLKALIRSWYPTCRDDGTKETTSLPIELIFKCEAVNYKISNKSQLQHLLNKELVKVCPYNYEMAEILISQLLVLESEHTDIVKTGKDVLCFLKSYKRHNPPSTFELEESLRVHPERLELPKIAKYRIPFHLLYCKPFQNKLLEHELNANNCEQWIGVSSFLALNVDQIFFIAAKNTLTNVSENKCNLTKRCWEIGTSNTAALTTIQKLIWKIQHPELAMACGNWVVQALPYSLDKVLAVQNCIQLASYWIDHSSSVHANDAFKKFSSMYRKLAIEYSLYKHKLAEPELIALANDPPFLIGKLYDHPCLSSLNALGTQSIPDIDSCVTEICEAAGESKIALQLHLLQKWLPLSANQNDSMEETVSNFKLIIDSNIIADDSQSKKERLSRTIYLLRTCPQEEAINYLLNIAFDTQLVACTDIRLSSLRCLIAVVDEETLMKQSHRSIEDIRVLLQTVTYVSRLEEVGYAITLSHFDSIDKTALVEGLWHALKHVPNALMLIVDICLNFKVNCTQLWGALLDQITRYVDDKILDSVLLQRVLLQIKLLPHLWVLPQLTSAWTRLIAGLLSSVSIPVRGDDLHCCIHATNLLTHHCPVEIDTRELIESCLCLQLPVLAVVIAAGERTQNSTSIEDVVGKFSKDAVLENYEMVRMTLMIPKNVDVYFKKLKDS